MSTPIGYLLHYSSRKTIHPHKGSTIPYNNTGLVAWGSPLYPSSEPDDQVDDKIKLSVQFEPVDGEGHFGYIKHVNSGKYVQPKGGQLQPVDQQYVVWHDGKHAACLFCFDERNNYIIHKGSRKVWGPKGGASLPPDETLTILSDAKNDVTKFVMSDPRGNIISPYGDMTLYGGFTILQATINAKADHTFEITVEVGEVRTNTVTEHDAWGVSVGAAKKLFQGSAEYSGYVEKSGTETWSSKTTIKRSIKVLKGHTAVTWQYDFGLSQLGDAYSYHSNLVYDNEDPNSPPTLDDI